MVQGSRRARLGVPTIYEKMSVTFRIPPYLRLHTEEAEETSPDEPKFVQAMSRLCRELSRQLGQQVEYHAGPISTTKEDSTVSILPVGTAQDADDGYFVVSKTSGVTSERCETVSHAGMPQILEALLPLAREFRETEKTLQRREAELAAQVPVVEVAREEEHLSARLQAALRCGAMAVRASAAALYLLDEGTSELKLRACWGIPTERLLERPRSLAGATADLEALTGHAVVLENRQLLHVWQVPEEGFEAAVCVPVSSPSTPLGTLWLFFDEERTISDEESNVVEVVAARVAADLERHVLLQHVSQQRAEERHLPRLAESWNAMPRTPPELAHARVAGWTERGGPFATTFHDWFMLDNGDVLMAVGQAEESGPWGASQLHEFRCYLRTATRFTSDLSSLAGDFLRQQEDPQGHCDVSFFLAALSPEGKELRYVAVGNVAATYRQDSRTRRIRSGKPNFRPDGELADPRERQVRLEPGMLFLFYSKVASGSGSDKALLQRAASFLQTEPSPPREAVSISPTPVAQSMVCLQVAGKLATKSGSSLQDTW